MATCKEIRESYERQKLIIQRLRHYNTKLRKELQAYRSDSQYRKN